ncbi:MAG: hypothetical protein ACK5E6_12250 [Cyanobacteriota bacterium]|jgi:hypothetical protein
MARRKAAWLAAIPRLLGAGRRTPRLKLRGQCCDRLRPSFVKRALEKALLAEQGAGMALVDWHWDSLRQRVSGVVLQNNELRPFRWWPMGNRLELRGAITRIRWRYQ